MKKVCVCHCKLSKITSAMMSNCQEAWKVEKVEDPAIVEEEEVTVIDDGDEQLSKRIHNLGIAASKRVTLYKPEVMHHIYETKEDKKGCHCQKSREEQKQRERNGN